ncbi:hypothetical protein [Nodosilinea sp. FACHB-13]|uniref:hypothetical protein n=1 Tax=Cyanophyceae TaxID=3028117 RepID=UPI00168402D7|nr:hypothetical protein [Nodosilinea sp. FACHB-13]MBD2106730.1 hypothetical protein [Nodosilinea sp. FACHB-13]
MAKSSGISLATTVPEEFTKIEVYCSGYNVLANVKNKTFERFIKKTIRNSRARLKCDALSGGFANTGYDQLNT